MASGTESDLVGLVLEGMSQGGPSAVTRHSDRAVVYVIYEEDEGTRAAVPRTRRNEEHAALQAAFSSSRAHLDIAELVVSSMVGDGDVVAVLGSCSAQGRATGCRFTTPFAQRARVRDGVIVECLMFEDSQAVALALRP